MSTARFIVALLLGCQLAVAGAETADTEMSHDQAVQALKADEPAQRAAAIERLAEIGTMSDADIVAARLLDEHEEIRELASLAIWHIWSRSGDAAIDQLFKKGLEQMMQEQLADALVTFSDIIRRKPGFAEGWNKRATVLFMLGRDDESLSDCEEALRRNRNHFGALSGMAQIHLRRGDPEKALRAYQRALQVNPNLHGGIAMLKMLDDVVRARRAQMI
jgi:tetratricopeptide (TPR) repeat protein